MFRGHFFRGASVYLPPAISAVATTEGVGGIANVNLPSGILAGDGIIIIVTAYSKPTFTTPAGWTLIGSGTADSAGAGPRTSVFAKTAVGTEGGTIQAITMSANREYTSFGLRITNWRGNAEAAFVSSGATLSPDPPAITPTWGVQTHLAIAIAGVRSNTTAVTAYPSGYTLNQQLLPNTANAGRACSMIAAAQIIQYPVDPGTFTTTNAGSTDSLAGTLVIR